MSLKGKNIDLEEMRHAALSSATRRSMLSLLDSDGLLGVRDLSRLLSLHENTVRGHISVLEESRLIEGVDDGHLGRGRPRKVYRLKAGSPVDVAAKANLLSEILMVIIKNQGVSKERISALAEAWGKSLVDAPAPHSLSNTEQAEVGLVRMLERLGFEPELSKPSEAESVKVTMKPCPFMVSTSEHKDIVCPIHLGIMRGALAEYGVDSDQVRLEPFVDRGHCRAVLAKSRQAPHDQA